MISIGILEMFCWREFGNGCDG